MNEKDKYGGLIGAEGYIDYDGIALLLSEVEQLREQAKHIKNEIYEMLMDYGMDDLWFSMWRQGTFTDETGEPYSLDFVFNNGLRDTQWHQLHLLLVRLARMIA